MPRLSLCLIAKDEEEMLEDCLRSVRGVVDEIIVCDTGSSDGTRELATLLGAQVIEHVWEEDFSAARNAALTASTGTHVLILDADERLTPGAGEVILAAIQDPTLDLGMLPLHNAERLDAPVDQVLSGLARRGDPVDLPRLFRRTPDLRWEGAIHESPNTWLSSAPRRIRRLEAPILHLGAVPSLRQARGKRERNIKLLQARVAQEPGNPQVYAYLAGELLHEGRREEAERVIEAGWAAAGRLGDGPRPVLVQLVTLRAHTLLEQGQVTEALAALGQAREWRVQHPNVDLLEALALRQLDPPARSRAAQLLERCLNWKQGLAQEPIPGALGWLSAQHLGELRLELGELDAAELAFGRALQEKPDLEGPALGMAELALRRGDAAAALRLVEPWLPLEKPDPWVLAAASCAALGEPGDMQALVRRAVQLADKGFVGRHRADWLKELLVEADLYAGKPHPGPGVVGRLGALASRLPNRDERAIHPEGAERVAVNLVRAGHPELLEPFFEPRADSLLPGLAMRVKLALAEQGIVVEDDGQAEFVFIGGAGRSGTTLFRAMLGAHSGIHCGPELKLVPIISGLREQWVRTMGKDLQEAGVGTEVLDEAVRSFITALLHGSAPEGMRVAEKTPHNLLHTALLGRLFPRARFLHVVRDGRAVAASLVRQRWVDPATGKPIWYCQDVEGASRYWVEVVSTIRHQAASVPGRYLEVRYEELVQSPEDTMRRVLAFLGEPWDAAVLAHHEADTRLSSREASSAAVAGALSDGALRKWRTQLSDADLSRFDQRTQSVLAELGYAS